ncbi:MAG: hypothetical protein GY820_46410 [Gammaproteobacteria bacterium]|nr:hypothetical protein [Gammaproteobacteria bacterium]
MSEGDENAFKLGFDVKERAKQENERLVRKRPLAAMKKINSQLKLFVWLICGGRSICGGSGEAAISYITLALGGLREVSSRKQSSNILMNELFREKNTP